MSPIQRYDERFELFHVECLSYGNVASIFLPSISLSTNIVTKQMVTIFLEHIFGEIVKRDRHTIISTDIYMYRDISLFGFPRKGWPRSFGSQIRLITVCSCIIVSTVQPRLRYTVSGNEERLLWKIKVSSFHTYRFHASVSAHFRSLRFVFILCYNCSRGSSRAKILVKTAVLSRRWFILSKLNKRTTINNPVGKR